MYEIAHHRTNEIGVMDRFQAFGRYCISSFARTAISRCIISLTQREKEKESWLCIAFGDGKTRSQIGTKRPCEFIMDRE